MMVTRWRHRVHVQRHVPFFLGIVVLASLGYLVAPSKHVLNVGAVNKSPVNLIMTHTASGMLAVVEAQGDLKCNSSSEVTILEALLEAAEKRNQDLELRRQLGLENPEDDELFYAGLPEEEREAQLIQLDRTKRTRIDAVIARGQNPGSFEVRPNDTVVLEGGKEVRLCATAEQMGEELVADVSAASLRVRAIIRRYFQTHDAEGLSQLPGRDFCKLNFVMGTSTPANGLANELYKGLNALALGIMLNRTMIWGEPWAQEGKRTAAYGKRDGLYGDQMLADYIQYSHKMFSMEEIKQLWITKGCSATRKLVVRQMIFNVNKDYRADIAHFCDDLTQWDVPVINFFDSVDSSTLQTLLKNQHFKVRRLAHNLFGDPLIPHSRPNLYGELLRAVVKPKAVITRAIERTLFGGPKPVIAVHVRQGGVSDIPSVKQAANCVKKALGNFDKDGLPRVVVASDDKNAREGLAKELEGVAQVIYFDSAKYLERFPEEERLRNSSTFLKASDWGNEQRWVAVIDFFLTAQATKAYITAGKQRVATTFAQLGAALAATYSYGPDSQTNANLDQPGHFSNGSQGVHIPNRKLSQPDSSSYGAYHFYSSFSQQRLKEGLGPCCSAFAWRPFSGPLSCGSQPSQCALTTLLPHTFYDTEWATPHPVVRVHEYLDKLGLPVLVTGALTRHDVEAYCRGEGTKREKHYLDVQQDLPSLT